MCRSRLAKCCPRGEFGRHQLGNCKNCETQELGEKLRSSEAFAEKCSLLVDTVIKYSYRGLGSTVTCVGSSLSTLNRDGIGIHRARLQSWQCRCERHLGMKISAEGSKIAINSVIEVCKSCTIAAFEGDANSIGAMKLIYL